MIVALAWMCVVSSIFAFCLGALTGRIAGYKQGLEQFEPELDALNAEIVALQLECREHIEQRMKQ